MTGNSAMEIECITEFADQVFEVLSINSPEDHLKAIKMAERVQEEYDKNPSESLDMLIGMIFQTVEKYEEEAPEFSKFNTACESVPQDLAILKTLMSQYKLSGADFKEEIGSKSFVSRILKGERQLTKQHIQNLSNRFGLTPSLFFT